MIVITKNWTNGTLIFHSLEAFETQYWEWQFCWHCDCKILRKCFLNLHIEINHEIRNKFEISVHMIYLNMEHCWHCDYKILSKCILNLHIEINHETMSLLIGNQLTCLIWNFKSFSLLILSSQLQQQQKLKLWTLIRFLKRF